MSEDNLVRQEQIAQIRKAIASTEALRGTLPDDQIDTMLAGLRASLTAFQTQLAGSGAIAQDGSTAVGERAVHVGGSAGDINTGVIINNRYAGAPPKDEAEAQRIYLRVLSLMVSHLPLGAFDPNEANPNATARRVQLDDVFIRLDTTTQVPKRADEPEPRTLVGRIRRKVTELLGRERQDEMRLGREETRPLRLIEAAAKRRWLVITGEPGSGKSTAVNFLIHCTAQASANPSAELPEIFSDDWPAEQRGLAPVRVILRDFEVWLSERPPAEAGPALLSDFIAHTLRQQNLAFAQPWLGEQIEAGQALVVLDGLDEVTTVPARLRVRGAIQDFAARYGGNRYLITCRTLSYQEPEGDDPDLRLNRGDFPVYEIAGLDDPKIQDFVTAWHEELERVGKITSDARAEYLRNRLWTALQQPDLKRLARNPLQLTLMAWVHTDNDELPDKRAKLYDKAVELLLWRWESQKQYRDARATLGELALQIGDGRASIERQLRRAAYRAHQAMPAPGAQAPADALADVDEADLQRGLAALKKEPTTRKGDENWARDVVEAIKTRSGLLARRGENKLTFPHRTFQEFLAGLHMLEDPNFVDQAVEKTAQLTLWREPILLAAGYTVFKQDRRDLALPLSLARRLYTARCDDEDLHWKRVWLAGEVLREVIPEDARDKDEGTFLDVQRLLTQLVTEGHLTPPERARAGRVLGRIGDPRFDPDRWFLPKDPDTLLGFVDVPAGPFYMGTLEDPLNRLMTEYEVAKDDRKYLLDEAWPDNEAVHLPRFLIARYPTTVAQFRAFVSATGFAIGDEDSLRDDDNDPVRWVSWHEALAYCRWLHEEIAQSPQAPDGIRRLIMEHGYRLTLPSEAEWEKAARGPSATRPLFPWGNQRPGEDQDDFANIVYARIGTTSAVGAFPKGRSPYGCMDVIGNVWEWTRSLWGREPERAEFVYPYGHRIAQREDLQAADDMLRVLRGGSFGSSERFARCAFRYRLSPDFRGSHGGFRIVVSPISLSPSGR